MAAGATDIAATKPGDETLNLADTIVIKRDSAFCVSLRDGRLPLEAGAQPLGLYLDDCRSLSAHELHVGGARPRLLVASADLGRESVHESVHELTRPSLPAWLNRVRVENLRVGSSRVGLTFERTAGGQVALTDARIDGELEVVLAISATKAG